MLVSWLALGCADDADSPYVRLGPVEHAVRASLALRGVRPTPGELARVRDDPAALEALVDDWVGSPELALTVQDLFAELLLVRADVIDPLPALGPLEGRVLGEMSGSLAEEPLELVRWVVDQDRPLTDLVTTDVAMADPVVAAVYGLPYNPAGPTWQPSRWTDGRPAAGLLVDSELWRRHESAGSNFNRRRANLVADVFLCADFARRDAVVVGGVDISDELEVAEAVSTDPACYSCHQALDPLATHFFGFKKQIKHTTVTKAFRRGCDPTPQADPFKPYAEAEFCYPLRPYATEDEAWWAYWELPAPGYYGRPERDLADLGASVAADPRFARCLARRFYGYLTQSDPLALDDGFAQGLQQTLVDSGFSARALAKAVVLSEPFAARGVKLGRTAEVAPAGMLVLRPEQLARSTEATTGFRWVVDPDRAGCDDAAFDGDVDGTECWGPVDLLRSDLFGFRSMAGGVDGNAITRPTHRPTPPRELVWERTAEEAADAVVRADLAADPEARRLLTRVGPEDHDRAAVVAQIAEWVPVLHGRFAAADDPVVQALADLWVDRYVRTGDVVGAWSLVATAMLVDPDAVFY